MRETAAIHNQSKKGRQKHLSSAILFLILTAIIATALLSVYVSLTKMGAIVDETSMSVANSSVDILVNEISDMKKQSVFAANALALSKPVIEAIGTKNTAELSSSAKAMTTGMEFDDILITDRNGSVLYSSGSINKAGTNLRDRTYIADALSGDAASDILSGSDYRYAVISCSPVVDRGTVVGTVTAVYALDNPDILDKLKEETGNEYTIFAGDERLNTTIMQNGERAVGTKLSLKVAELVIGKQQTYYGSADILGQEFSTGYVPIVSTDGAVTGILFSGFNLSGINRSEASAQLVSIGACAILVVLFSAVGLIILQKRINSPLKIIVAAAQAIETGTMGPETTKLLASINSKDEMGLLADSMSKAIHSIENVIADAGALKNAAANNDLTVKPDIRRHQGKYKDVILLAEGLFDEMSALIKKINQAAGRTLNSSQLISAGAMSLASGSTEQASAIEEISVTVGQIAQMSKKSSDIAVASNASVAQVQKEAEVGSEKMKALLDALNDIESASGDIAIIIKTIEDLAFQTNILALNASVEAARAGNQGKGFAVVASEVKSLAERSAKAAQETNELISTSIDKSKAGARIGADMRKSLDTIVSGIHETASAMDKIATESTYQVQAIEQLNVGIDQISYVVSNNTATAEESASSSQEMSAQAEMLNSMVSVYRLD